LNIKISWYIGRLLANLTTFTNNEAVFGKNYVKAQAITKLWKCSCFDHTIAFFFRFAPSRIQ